MTYRRDCPVETARRERRAATARMTFCACGNVARLGTSECGRCAGRREDEAEERAEAAEAVRRAALIKLAAFDTTRFPGMEAEAIRQAEALRLDPIDLLQACEAIFRAGLGEVGEREGREC